MQFANENLKLISGKKLVPSLEYRKQPHFHLWFNWTASSEFGTYRLCEQRRFRRACASAQSRQNLCCLLEGSGSLRIRAVSPEPLLLAHTSSESRGTFRQKARSLALLNGWACAVKICHDGMLEDTNSLDGAQLMCMCHSASVLSIYLL